MGFACPIYGRGLQERVIVAALGNKKLSIAACWHSMVQALGCGCMHSMSGAGYFELRGMQGPEITTLGVVAQASRVHASFGTIEPLPGCKVRLLDSAPRLTQHQALDFAVYICIADVFSMSDSELCAAGDEI